MRNTLIVLAVSLFAAATAQAQGSANQAIDTGQHPDANESKIASAIGSTSGSATPTVGQVHAASSKIVNATTNRQTATLWTGARDKALMVVLAQSCYPMYDVGKYLNRHSAPNASGDIYLDPMYTMDHHPKSQCLTVDRVDDLKSTAKNAIAFRVIFVSDASGESKSLNYEMERQPDNTWLFLHAGL